MNEVSKSVRVKVGKDLQFAMHLVFIFLITVSSVSGLKTWLQQRGMVASASQVKNVRVFWPQNALAIFPSPSPTDAEDAQDQELPDAFVDTTPYRQALTHQLPVLKHKQSQPVAKQRLSYRQRVFHKTPVRRRYPTQHAQKTKIIHVSAQPASPKADREYQAYMNWVKRTLKTYQQGS